MDAGSTPARRTNFRSTTRDWQIGYALVLHTSQRGSIPLLRTIYVPLVKLDITRRYERRIAGPNPVRNAIYVPLVK